MTGADDGFGRLVVDAKVLFGALLRDSTNRNVILHGQLDLHAPESIWDELDRNRDFLIKKSRVPPAAFDLLIDGLAQHVRRVPLATIRPHLAEALARLGEAHRLDAPYVAAAMALDAGVWSHDKAVAERAGLPVFTTADVVAGTGR